MELCFIVLKPDALERGLVGEILTRLERAGFRPDGVLQRSKTEDWVRRHFAPVIPSDEQIEFLTVGPVLGFGVAGEQACPRVQTIVGDLHTPGTIIGDFGIDHLYDLVMVSTSHDETLRQSEHFYDPETDREVTDAS